MKTLNTSRYEVQLIAKIAARAVKAAAEHGVTYDHLTAMMDIEHAHAAIPLDLAALLAVDEGTFAHDVFGIRRHIDRTTGDLGDCFLPKMALRA